MPDLVRARVGRAAVAALFGVSAIAGCRGATLPPGSTEPIRVGVVLTLDLDGIAYREAIELATREVNAAGGALPGRPIELLVAESMNDPDRAVMEAQRLLDEGAVAILGDGGSTNTLAIAREVTTPGRIPHLSCSATSPNLTALNAAEDPEDRFFFRTAPSDVNQATVLTTVAIDDASCARVVLLHQNDDYGTPIATALAADLRAASITVAATIPYTFGQPSYTSEVAMAIAATPDCVAILGYPQEAGLIIRAWGTASGPSVRWIGTDALFTPMFVSEAGSAAVIDGFLGTAPQTAPATPEYGDFAGRLRAAFARPADFEPEQYTASCYDAAALLYLAIAEAGSTDGDALRDALRRVSRTASGTVVRATDLARAIDLLAAGDAVNYEGASGSVDFDDQGDVVTDYIVWRFVASTSTFTELRTVLAGDL